MPAMFRFTLLLLSSLFVLLPARAALGQASHSSPEYVFFRTRFHWHNETYCREQPAECQKRLNEAFDVIAENVAEIQKHAPKVTLGGMLSLIYWESNDHLAFYNTRDKENSYKKYLRSDQPYYKQPFAHYSYQFGLVPFHMSNFRPCIDGTQPARERFSTLLSQIGFSVTPEQLNSVKAGYEEVCRKARRPVKDQLLPVDYYILAAQTDFHVPINSAGSDLKEIDTYPFYFTRITAPFFFSPILRGATRPRPTVTDDTTAIIAFSGKDSSYAKKAQQILNAWTVFSTSAAAKRASEAAHQ